MIRKQRTYPLPLEIRKEIGEYYIGGKPMLIQHIKYLEDNNLILKENGQLQ